MIKRFYSHGKLLLSGEYLVLDGAKALALPTKLGQDLNVEPNDEGFLHWTAIDSEKYKWLDISFDLPDLRLINNDSVAGQRLEEILKAIRNQNPDFLISGDGFNVSTHLEFPNEWGLGSSSTLIANLAKWAEVDPYKLLKDSFGGSGYDLACASAHGPIFFSLKNGQPKIQEVEFDPVFKSHLYFLYLNRKQDSRASISHYREAHDVTSSDIDMISKLSEAIVKAEEIDEFRSLIEQHERILSGILKIPSVKEELFPDFRGSMKSLGGWGGDMVLVISQDDPSSYFSEKGFDTLIHYSDLIL